MNRKTTSLLFLSVVILMLIVPTVAALDIADVSDALRSVNDLTNLYPDHKDGVSFLVFFVLFTAIFWFGIQMGKEKWNWPDGTENAMTVVAFALGIGAALGIGFWQQSSGTYIIDKAGSIFMLLAIVIPLGLLGLIFYRESEDKKSTPVVWSTVILFFYYIINAFVDDFTQHLGPLGPVIEMIAVLAATVIILGLLKLVWESGTHLFASTGGRSALSDTRMAETEKSYKQRGKLEGMKRTLGSQEESTASRKEERKVRKSVRKVDRDLKDAEEILGELHQAVAQKKPQLITGDWKKWKGELKKLEKLKVRIGGYLGIVTSVLAETETLSIKPNDQTRLRTFESLLMDNSRKLEQEIKKLNKNIRQIDDATPVNSPLWNNSLNAVSSSSDLLKEVHKDALGALALERRVREYLKIA